MSRKTAPGRREEILAAARAVFQENGYDGAHMSDIARLAGVADGTIYLYFHSKLDLVHALCENYLKRVVDTLAPILAKADSAAAIAESVHATLVLAEEDRDISRLLDLRASLGKRSHRLQWDRELAQMLARKIDEGQEQGQMWPCDAEIAAELVMGLLEWITKFCLVWTNRDMARYEDTAIAMLQHALLKENYKIQARQNDKSTQQV